jgi:BASS family bile acid:Na+ symporter
MRAVLAQTTSLAVIVFAASSMLSVGLAYSLRDILRPLREVRAVFRALVANFVLVPLLALAIERVVPMAPPLALGLFLLAGSAGAPFLIKLTRAARHDVALSAALLLLLVPCTVVFLPLYVPMATAHPALTGLTYIPGSVLALGLPLVSTMILPLVVGLILRTAAPRWAARLVPIMGKLASVALVVVIAGNVVANFQAVVRLFQTGVIVASLLLVVGAFVIGHLLSRPDRGMILGLGTAQRNIAAAMVVASRDFGDPDILVMVTVTVVAGLFVLFPIAWLGSRRAPRLGPPTKALPAGFVGQP